MCVCVLCVCLHVLVCCSDNGAWDDCYCLLEFAKEVNDCECVGRSGVTKVD